MSHQSLNEVCKQTTFRNINQDNSCREKKANISLFVDFDTSRLT